MSLTIHEKFSNYLLLQKNLVAIRKEQKNVKKELDTLEADIMEYMVNNEMNNISIKEGEIILYPKKISQTFKKETIIETLNVKLKNTLQSEELAESILENKKFITQDKIKVKLK